IDYAPRPASGQPPGYPAAPRPAAAGNLRAVRHGGYSQRLKAPRVREVLDELLAEHPQEAPAKPRALAELFVTGLRMLALVSVIAGAAGVAAGAAPRTVVVGRCGQGGAMRGRE